MNRSKAGWGDGSRGDVLAVQVWGPQFRASASTQKSGVAIPVCNSSAVGHLVAYWSSGTAGMLNSGFGDILW